MNYVVHPVFTFGTTEVNGIWVGKFETTGTIDSPIILPNTTSLTNQTVKAMYDNSRAMENNVAYGFGTNGNIHMAKDSEWGAVAYLSQSKYGKYGNPIYTGVEKEIYINNINIDLASGFQATITGCAGNTVSADMVRSGTCPVGNQYQTNQGVKASTTGNIYGVYDMSGGTWEYTMSMYRPTASTSVTDSSGFEATTSLGNLPAGEYWDRYITDIETTACGGGICYGSALSETSGWYGDYADFVGTVGPWSIRGGDYSYTTYAGTFIFNDYMGGLIAYARSA